MRVIEIITSDRITKLEVRQLPIPTPNSTQILIKVFASGLNRADILQKKGKYPPPAGASDILGLEVAGDIVKIGDAVSGFKVGDKGCALLEGGGYAEYALADYRQVLPIPKNLDYIQGAALPEAFFTAWSNLFHAAHLQKNESLLVHGGTSGVGIAAIALAKLFNIECFATAGSEAKCEFLRGLGIKRAINYKTENFVEVIKSETVGKGVNVILDMVGGDYFQKNMESLTFRGRLISIALQNGAKAEVNFTPLLIKNLTIIGTTLRNKSVEEKALIAQDLKDKVWPALTNGAISPVIDRVFALEDAEKAHELMQSGQHIGKIILKV
jgi:NADPH2:quinone reductase